MDTQYRVVVTDEDGRLLVSRVRPEDPWRPPGQAAFGMPPTHCVEFSGWRGARLRLVSLGVRPMYLFACDSWGVPERLSGERKWVPQERLRMPESLTPREGWVRCTGVAPGTTLAELIAAGDDARCEAGFEIARELGLVTARSDRGQIARFLRGDFRPGESVHPRILEALQTPGADLDGAAGWAPEDPALVEAAAFADRPRPGSAPPRCGTTSPGSGWNCRSRSSPSSSAGMRCSGSPCRVRPRTGFGSGCGSCTR
ncbi:hypothetical protein [Dactylosporangium darangshiense]|uniref:hypothetical protein n=1 Tax=Dactylosporangium darangshiense TaxID=579108 RepID=UPI0036261862